MNVDIKIEAKNSTYQGWFSAGGRFVCVGFVVLMLSYLPYQLKEDSGDGKLQAMELELERVRVEIVLRETEVQRRRTNVRALKSDTSAIEDIARRDLRMLYPHETMLHISDADAKTRKIR